MNPRLASYRVSVLALIACVAVLQGCGGGGGGASTPPPPPPVAAFSLPAEVLAGQRLFLETRFAQAFKAAVDRGATINGALAAADADPVMATTQTTNAAAPLPGPFAGLTMNCAACHLVDEHAANAQGGVRAYADFARRSPIPARADGRSAASRNSPSLVAVTLPRTQGAVFHYDGEFATLDDLVASTLTGRNYGWLAAQHTEAIAHVARVIREDDGRGSLAQQSGALSYRTLLTGTASTIPDRFRLPAAFRVNVETASDAALVDGVARLVAAYVDHLRFSQRDAAGAAIRSPYEVFLELNALPLQPDAGEAPFDYNQRLIALVLARERAGTLQFVTRNPNRADGAFLSHRHAFVFGAQELAGFKIFFNQTTMGGPTPEQVRQGGVGTCHACHTAPAFTNFRAHNTGITQDEYDGIHGPGAFNTLPVPSLADRNATPDAYLPATPAHPGYAEPFRAAARAGDRNLADLGIWNILLNPDFPAPQANLASIVCNNQVPCPFTASELLGRSLGRFKTPSLRDLGHSAPYAHNGAFDTLEQAIAHYIPASNGARAATLRNVDPGLKFIAIVEADVAPLAAFLRSLDEDYQRVQRPD